jgi:hypothetical protein
MRLLTILTAVVTFAAFLALPASAASITVVSMHYSAAHPVPHLHYEGDTLPGDVDALTEAYDRFVNCRLSCIGPEGAPTAVLTLNGYGGSYSEGLALADFLRANHIATVVERGAVCYSACAFAFLGGSAWSSQEGVETYIDRVVEPGSTVGFHAPYKQEAAFRAALEERGVMAAQSDTRDALALMVKELIKWNVEPEVIFKMMEMGPDDTYNLKTPLDLYRTRVNLPATPTAGWVSDRAEAIRNACLRLLAIDERGDPADAWQRFQSDYTPLIGKTQFSPISGFKVGGDGVFEIGSCAAPEDMLALENGDLDVSLYFNPALSAYNTASTSFFSRHNGWSSAGYGRRPTTRIFAKGPMNSYFLPLDTDIDALDRPAENDIDRNRFNLLLPPLLPLTPIDLMIEGSTASSRVSRLGNVYVFERVGPRELFDSALASGKLGRNYTSDVGNEVSFSRAGTFADTGVTFAWFGFLSGGESSVVEALVLPSETGAAPTREETELLLRIQCETEFGGMTLTC